MSASIVIIFRIIHILAGVAWVGSLFLFVFFIEPSSRAIGPAAAPFMQELVGKRQLVRVILWLGTITIVAGAVLYWSLMIEFGSLSNLLGSARGLSLTIGGTAAIVAFLLGMLGTRPNVARLMAAGQKAAASEGGPAPEVLAEIQTTQRLLRIYARTGLALLTVAVIAMASARYA